MKLIDLLTVTPRHGVVEDIDREEYFNTPGLNPSTIVYRRKSALAARHAYEQHWNETEAMLFGSCCHSILFEGQRFDQDWAVWPADKRRYGKEWDAFRAEHAGKKIIKDGDQLYGFRHALNAATAATKKPAIRKLIAEGVSEVALFSEESGLQVKGRVDWIDTAGGNLIDAKFTNDVTPSIFGRSAGRFGYHIKMALYREWFQRESGKALNGVYLITVETVPPYDVALVPITELQLEDGLAQGRELISQLANNIRQNKFPGVDEGNPEIELALPMWALMEGKELVFDE